MGGKQTLGASVRNGWKADIASELIGVTKCLMSGFRGRE